MFFHQISIPFDRKEAIVFKKLYQKIFYKSLLLIYNATLTLKPNQTNFPSAIYTQTTLLINLETHIKAAQISTLSLPTPFLFRSSLLITVWNTMMQGHETVAKTAPKTTPRPTQEVGGEAAASAKIDNVVRVPPPKGFVFNRPNSVQQEEEVVEERIDSGVPLYRKVSPKFFRRPVEGPWVVKVYPDGRPVEDEQNAVPQDEDLRQYLLAKVKLPAY